jgi:hypothetical protein
MSSQWLRPHTMGGLDPVTARFAAVTFALEERPSVTPVRMVRSALSRACVKILYCAQHPERSHRRRRNRTFEAWLSSRSFCSVQGGEELSTHGRSPAINALVTAGDRSQSWPKTRRARIAKIPFN